MTSNTLTTILVALCSAIPAFSDVKITATYTSDGQTSETTVYGNGSRVRYEYGKGLVLIRQCDQGRMVQLDDKSKTYSSLPIEKPEAAAEPAKVALNDTNERKDAFGYSARHLKMSEAGEGKNERTETDGWYIELKELGVCTGLDAASATRGYPTAYTVITYAANGKPSTTASMQVTGLVVGPLDSALFEIPQGYADAAQAAAKAPAVKAPGAVRVGAVALRNKSNSKTQGTTAFDQLLGQLRAAKLEVVSLPDGSDEALEQKARQVNCDYLLYTEFAGTEKPATGKLTGILHKAPGIGQITGGEVVEARMEYRLVAPGAATPLLAASAVGKTGGTFDWKAAAMLATNFLPMTMAFRTLGGAFSPAMMTALMSHAGPGAALTAMDPMMGGLTMILQAANPAMAAAGNAKAEGAAIAAAIDLESKAVIAQLKPAAK